MRRSVRALPSVLAVVAVLAAAPTAQAQDGGLMVNGDNVGNSGCVFLGVDDTRSVQNNTSSVVTLYPLAGCSGDPTGVLAPGEAAESTSRSAQIASD